MEQSDDAQVVNGIDPGLNKNSQTVLLDIDPDLSLDFLKKAAALSGKTSPSHLTREQLVETHNEHLKKLVKHVKAPKTVKKVVLSLAYPPSIRSSRDLEKILLSELLVEFHHENRVVVVRSITAPYKGAGTVTIVEDETGHAEKLAIYNQSDASILSAIPEGTVVAIKEPYYKFNGDDDFMLCVDHPSDIILLDDNDPLAPQAFRPSPDEEVASRSCTQWISDGDKAFINRNLAEAVRCYSKALDLATSGEATQTANILAKRAGTHLALQCYDSALSDALASRDSNTCSPAQNWKAYLTAARAAYGLGRFRECRRHLDAALERNPEGAAAVRKEVARCARRIDEEMNGKYDFAALTRLVSKKNIHMDSANFTRKTVVQDSQHHGRGLFATCDIHPGELLFVEKATCLPNEYNITHNGAALYANMVEQCVNNPSIHAKNLELYGGTYKRTGAEGKPIDGVPVIDVFLIESIRRTNCFMPPHTSLRASMPGWSISRDGMARGMWAHAAHMNHSCWPNSARSFIGDLMVSVATEHIPAGGEITQVYLPSKAVYQAREDQFRQWGFKCACRLCVVEDQSPLSNHETRRKLLSEIDTIIQKKKQSRQRTQPSTIRAVEKLTRRLEDLHEDAVYARIPRLLLVWPTIWLTEAHRDLKNHARTVRWAAQVLRNFGFLVDDAGGWDIYARGGSAGVTTFEAIKALGHARDAYRALGEAELSARCVASARLAWRMLMGFDAELGSSASESDSVGDGFRGK